MIIDQLLFQGTEVEQLEVHRPEKKHPQHKQYLSILPSWAEISNSCIFLVILSVLRTTSSWVGMWWPWSAPSMSDPRPSLDADLLPPDFVPLQQEIKTKSHINASLLHKPKGNNPPAPSGPVLKTGPHIWLTYSHLSFWHFLCHLPTCAPETNSGCFLQQRNFNMCRTLIVCCHCACHSGCRAWDVLRLRLQWGGRSPRHVEPQRLVAPFSCENRGCQQNEWETPFPRYLRSGNFKQPFCQTRSKTLVWENWKITRTLKASKHKYKSLALPNLWHSTAK